MVGKGAAGPSSGSWERGVGSGDGGVANCRPPDTAAARDGGIYEPHRSPAVTAANLLPGLLSGCSGVQLKLTNSRRQGLEDCTSVGLA